MSAECEKCGEHILDCLCHLGIPMKWISRKEALEFWPNDDYNSPDPIRSYDAKIVIKNEETVKSFDPVQNDCERVLNFKKENQ